MATPKDYGLPHDNWYPNQEETIKWVGETDGTVVIEAPTGSGKTGILAAQAMEYNVLSLVRTKFLQRENYELSYGFDALYGRGNYPCIHIDADPGAMADECLFADAGAHKCPNYNECPYFVARDIAKGSNKATLNYSYWFNVFKNWEGFDLLGCDEAHQLSDLTLDWAGTRLSERVQKKYNLPTFPMIYSSKNTSIMVKSTSPLDKAKTYLMSCIARLSDQLTIENRKPDDFKDRRKIRSIEILTDKIKATVQAMNQREEGWYIRSGPTAGTDGGWGFIARPLTARFHFPAYFTNPDWKLLIMSATIGNPEVFTSELGIEEYEFKSVPSSWLPRQRPVMALDVPRLGRKSPPSAYNKQADEIAKAIRSVDPRWSGIVHTKSISAATDMARKLHSRGLHDRVFVTERAPTNMMVEQWKDHLKKRPNSILVSWAMWEGYDGTEEKINIVAKTPYPFLGDAYEKERQKYDGKFYLQRTAWQMEQGLGRTRRGRKEDYNIDGKVNGLVAIADGGWKYIKKYLSASLVESIQTGG